MSKNESPNIKDIAKFKKMQEDLKNFKALEKVVPFASPFLSLLGVNTDELKKAFTNADLDKMEKDLAELSEMPDKFNDIFALRGWILFEFFDLNTAKKALEIAKTDIDEAENFLVDYYSYEEVKRYLYMMHGIQAFRPRMELAELALLDYKEERYHACIPVILMLMDGLVNDLSPQNLGMSAENSNLTAWDSITAHDKGLNKLKEVLFKTRKATRTESISVPYRHGILHGMDLGYANKMVAAKTWAALFAVGDWAAKVERKELSEPPPKPETTWSEILEQLQEHNNWKTSFDENFENWKPRVVEVEKDFPRTGKVEDFQDGTPEQKLVEFLIYWQKKNYGQMANCVWSGLKLPGKQLAGRAREAYSSFFLKDFELIEIIDEAPSVTEIKVLLTYENNGNLIKNEVKFRLLINEGEDKRPLMRNMLNATWGIANWGWGVIKN